MLVDTHCHLNFEHFDRDRSLVLERAKQTGIIRILNPGINLDSSQAAVELTHLYSEVYAAIGFHPNETQYWNSTSLDLLRELTYHSKVVAIGEIGLDYYWDRSPEHIQKLVLIQQLQLAQELNLPVVIHTRNPEDRSKNAIGDVINVITEWMDGLREQKISLAERPGVFHSFSGNVVEAERLVDLGFCLGITGPVTFRNADMLREVIGAVPIENILIETDAPFLTPHPYRGKRNEPGYVKFIAEKIAQIKNLPTNVVSEITTGNAERLFFW